MTNLSEALTSEPGRVDSNFFERRLAAESGEASPPPQAAEQPQTQQEPDSEYYPDPVNGAQGYAEHEAGSDQSHLEGDQLAEDQLDDPASPDEGEQPEPSAPASVNVNGRDYTAEDIGKLETGNLELRRTFNRKAAERAADIRRLETMDSELEAEYALPLNRVGQRYNQLRNMDTSQLKPEEIPQWQQAVRQAQVDYHAIKADRDRRQQRIQAERERLRDLQTQTTIEILTTRDDRWADPEQRAQHYAKLRDFAVNSGDYTPEEFDDIGDHRIILGLQAQMDAANISQHVVDKRVVRQRQGVPQQSSQPRSPDGRFTSAEREVRESTNARADGSLRNLFERRLENEERQQRYR